MKKTIILAVVLGVAAGVGGRMVLRGTAGPASAEAAPVTPLEAVSANGTVEGARPEVALRPQVAGILTAVNVHENDAVAPGQVLA